MDRTALFQSVAQAAPGPTTAGRTRPAVVAAQRAVTSAEQRSTPAADALNTTVRMPWNVFVRPHSKPTLCNIDSGEELVDAPKPSLHRSPSSLERAFERINTEILRVRRMWLPWQDLWEQRRGPPPLDQDHDCIPEDSTDHPAMHSKWGRAAVWGVATFSCTFGLGMISRALLGTLFAVRVIALLVASGRSNGRPSPWT